MDLVSFMEVITSNLLAEVYDEQNKDVEKLYA